MRRLLCSVGLGMLLCGAAAQAAPVSATTLLSQYNLITSGNATTNGDIEGTMIVGGNFTGAAGTANLFNNSANLPTPRTSYIYGNNTSGINVDNGGSLYIAGNNSGNINLNGTGNKLNVGGTNSGGANINGSSGGAIYVGVNHGNINYNGAAHANSPVIVPPYAISDVVKAVKDYSTYLAGQSSNGSITKNIQTNDLKFASNATQAVFNLTASQLLADLNNASIDFVLTANATAVVNVDLQGSNLTIPSSAHFASSTPLQNVLFNFYNGTGTTLTFTTQWQTSIVAMGSTVTNTTPINGAVAAAALFAKGELHNYLPKLPSYNPPPVPEPASMALVLAGLAGVFWLTRRRMAALKA